MIFCWAWSEHKNLPMGEHDVPLRFVIAFMVLF